jgi:hypothetical protein
MSTKRRSHFWFWPTHSAARYRVAERTSPISCAVPRRRSRSTSPTGAGEYAAADKARFYRMARRSATESAAILDACRLLSLIDTDKSQQGRELLLRVVAMLTAMVVKLSGAGSGAGSGAAEDLATNSW